MAYSAKWNPWRLENSTYSFWAYFLIALTWGMGPVLMIPQYTLENIKEPSLKDVSGATVAKKNVMTFTPDFIIVILSTVSCATKTPMPPVPFPVNLISWPQLEVTNMTILVLIEVKHPAPIEPSQLLNSASNSCLSSHWYKIVSSHRLNLHFLNKKKLDRILLIACAGDWRSWTIVTCNKQLSVKKQPEDSLPFNCIFDNDDDYDKDPERQEHDDPYIPGSQDEDNDLEDSQGSLLVYLPWKFRNIRETHSGFYWLPPIPPLYLSDKIPYKLSTLHQATYFLRIP